MFNSNNLHNAAVEAVSTALRDGGCTFRLSPKHSFIVPNTEGTGYMVSLDASVVGVGESKVALGGMQESELHSRAYYEIGLRSLLINSDFNLWVGMWEDDDELYFDISKWVYTKEEAVALGRKYNQKAIYDIAAGESIEL